MLMVAKVSETAEYFQKIAAHRLLGAVLKAQFYIKKALKRIRHRKDKEALMVKKKRVQAPTVDVKSKSKGATIQIKQTELKKTTSNGATFLTQDKVEEVKKKVEEVKKADDKKVFRTTDPKPNASCQHPPS